MKLSYHPSTSKKSVSHFEMTFSSVKITIIVVVIIINVFWFVINLDCIKTTWGYFGLIHESKDLTSASSTIFRLIKAANTYNSYVSSMRSVSYLGCR